LVKGGASDAGGAFTAEFLSQTPLSPKAQKDMLRLYSSEQPDLHAWAFVPRKEARLAKISYEDFLLNHAKVDKQVVSSFMVTPGLSFRLGPPMRSRALQLADGQPDSPP